MKKYAIWNKQDNIITPIGEVLTPEQWIARYPVAGLNSITVICSAGEINGAYFGTLGALVQQYEGRGCNFDACTTPEEKLAVIEAYDAEAEVKRAEAAARKAQEEADAKATEEMNAASLASIAASMEYQNMLTLPDEEDI